MGQGQARREELNSISSAARLRGINQSMFFASLSLVSLVTFFTMHFRGVPFTPSNVFTAIALFNIIKMPLTNFIPFAVEKLTEVRVAFGRITRFLELGEEVANDQASRFEKQAAQVRTENARVEAESLTAGDHQDGACEFCVGAHGGDGPQRGCAGGGGRCAVAVEGACRPG